MRKKLGVLEILQCLDTQHNSIQNNNTPHINKKTRLTALMTLIIETLEAVA
jgi:hypothetical protein